MPRRFPRPRSILKRRHRDVGVAATGRSLLGERLGARYDEARDRYGAGWVWSGIAVFVVALLLLITWPLIHVHLQALTALKLMSGDTVPAPIRAITVEPFTTQDLTLQTDAGPVLARMYTPVKHPNAPGLVVFHGVHHLGMNEPRLMSFASAMASVGLQVLTPELPDIKDYHISESSVAVIGSSTKWFAQRKGKPVGVLGLSFSGGLSLVAAANPAYRPSMKVLLAVGAQDAMERVAAYYRTGEAPRPDGSLETLPAHEYGPLVLEYEHVEEFVPSGDTEAIRKVLRAHLYEDKQAEQDAMEDLSPRQQAEAAELMDAGSTAVQAMLRTSALRHQKELAGLSPETHLGELTVPVFLLHGEADNIIPAAETLWMASELRSTTLQAALVSPVLSHIDMQKSPSAWDEFQLVHFMARVLHAIER
ncbi:alpha/beta hydrolase family protein [Terriglobus aquaticus]|uniref:Alpha/beta hydrolase n=1 Tax=Terriglobus aquaticus TaxID=940139 RepID=A0ABW9KLB9_9BACT|nr:alpha/beta hydrolase [Terriglobus aquaticus]